ncbi:MAG: hypothetical protein ACRCVT_00135 [Leadbetterella sp.]
MKITSYLLGILLLVFACEDSNEPVKETIDPDHSGRLKNYTATYKAGSKSYIFSLDCEYTNNEISKVIEKDPFSFDFAIPDDKAKTTFGLTRMANGDYLLSNVFQDFEGTFKDEVKAVKSGNKYVIDNGLDSDGKKVYLIVDLNSSGQMVKKTISGSLTNATTLGTIYMRYEYDAKGNCIKVYSGNPFNETLSTELTYDDKPNPLKNLKWVYRFEGFLELDNLSYLYESNNNVVTGKEYFDGKVLNNITKTYEYHSKNKFPKMDKTMSGGLKVADGTYTYY